MGVVRTRQQGADREQTGMELTLTVTLVMAGLTLGHWNPLVSVCPGEGSRYGDFKCIHDRTHRVCAKLVENSDNSCREVMSHGHLQVGVLLGHHRTAEMELEAEDLRCSKPGRLL